MLHGCDVKHIRLHRTSSHDFLHDFLLFFTIFLLISPWVPIIFHDFFMNSLWFLIIAYDFSDDFPMISHHLPRFVSWFPHDFPSFSTFFLKWFQVFFTPNRPPRPWPTPSTQAFQGPVPLSPTTRRPSSPRSLHKSTWDGEVDCVNKNTHFWNLGWKIGETHWWWMKGVDRPQ